MKAIVVSLLLLAGVSACGSEDPALTNAAATTLSAQVADARAAVASGDLALATELLNQLDVTVAELRAADDINDARAEDVLAAVGDARDALTRYAATTTTSTTTTTTATTTTTEPERDDDNGRGRDKKQDEGDGD